MLLLTSTGSKGFKGNTGGPGLPGFKGPKGPKGSSIAAAGALKSGSNIGCCPLFSNDAQVMIILSSEDKTLDMLDEEMQIEVASSEEMLVGGMAGLGSLMTILLVTLTLLMVVICRLKAKYSRYM